MTTFLTTFALTFLLFSAAVLCINYCKSRANSSNNRSKHQLTGMCHRSGSAACCGSSRFIK